MARAQICAVFVLFSAALVALADTSSVKIAVRLVEPATFPVVLELGAQLPKLVVLVTNPTPVARQLVVEAFAVAEDKTVLKQYSLSENVRAGDSALIKTTLQPCHAGFTEASCSIAAIQVRAHAGDRVYQPRSLPSWIQLGETNVGSSFDSFGKRQADASVVVTNRGSRDAHVYLRFRLYNAAGFQVAVCSNEPRPIFSDDNLLAPGGLSVRLGCSVSPFQDVADVPSRVRVELLGWEHRQ